MWLAQVPGQLIQGIQVAACGKAVALLDPGDSLLMGLAFDPLVAVDHHLHPKGWVAAHFDRQMPPVGVQQVKVIMLDQRPGLRSTQDQLTLAVLLGFPDQPRCPSHEDGKYATEVGFLRQKRFGTGMFGFVADRAVQNRHALALGESVDTAAKVAGHLLEAFLIQGHAGIKDIPPSEQAATGLSQGKIAVEDQPIDAVVTANVTSFLE
ncbi:MAG: hypothetical protein HY360_06900 [Verrucomicrobia bacterium]|nr:hypothetical protein [Verrucomicrobiota bacterium]